MSICKEEIFEGIFIDLNPVMQRFGQSKGLDSQKAADIAQDAFLRLWKNCNKVKTEAARSWLFTSIKNLIIDDYRKSKTQLKIKENIVQNVEVKDGQYEMEVGEFKLKFQAAINSMKPGSKEVFLLHRFNNMSYQEISNVLEISRKAVEKRMSLALKHLAEENILKKR